MLFTPQANPLINKSVNTNALNIIRTFLNFILKIIKVIELLIIYLKNVHTVKLML